MNNISSINSTVTQKIDPSCFNDFIDYSTQLPEALVYIVDEYIGCRNLIILNLAILTLAIPQSITTNLNKRIIKLKRTIGSYSWESSVSNCKFLLSVINFFKGNELLKHLVSDQTFKKMEPLLKIIDNALSENDSQTPLFYRMGELNSALHELIKLIEDNVDHNDQNLLGKIMGFSFFYETEVARIDRMISQEFSDYKSERLWFSTYIDHLYSLKLVLNLGEGPIRTSLVEKAFRECSYINGVELGQSFWRLRPIYICYPAIDYQNDDPDYHERLDILAGFISSDVGNEYVKSIDGLLKRGINEYGMGVKKLMMAFVISRPTSPYLSKLIETGVTLHITDIVGRHSLSNPRKYYDEDYKAFISKFSTLIDSKCDVNIAGKDGRTPLILAVQKRQLSTVNQLLALGARIDIKDSSGETALDKALKFRYKNKDDEAIIQILQSVSKGLAGNRNFNQ